MGELLIWTSIEEKLANDFLSYFRYMTGGLYVGICNLVD